MRCSQFLAISYLQVILQLPGLPQIISLCSYKASDVPTDIIRHLEWEECNTVSQKNDAIIYKIYFVKKSHKPKRKTDNSLTGSMRLSSSSEYLEMVFINKSQQLIISNGEKFGIYKSDNSKIKEWLLKELRSIE